MDAFTVVVLIVAGHEPEATTQGLQRAVGDAMGPAVVVEVREAPVEPDGDEAMAIERAAHAMALAEVESDESDGRHVRLRVHLASSGRWLERQVAFEASDADAERGRTLGFALAAMVPLEPADSPSDTAATSPTPPPTPQAMPVAPSATARESVRQVEPTEPWLAFDVLALGATGIEDAGNEAGGGLAAHWFPYRNVALRLGLSLRAGTFEPANGMTLDVAGSAGVAWHPWRAVSGQPFGLSFRADYLVVDQSLTHNSTGPRDPDRTRVRTVSAVDGVVDGSVRVARGVEFVVGLGTEGVFGLTRIAVASTQVATIPPVRAVAESGVRIEF